MTGLLDDRTGRRAASFPPVAFESESIVSIETTITFCVSAAFVVPPLAGRGDRDVIGRARRIDRTYWDTADLRLARHGFALCHREVDDGSAPTWTLELEGERDGALAPRRVVECDGDPVAPPRRLTDAVAGITGSHALANVAHLRSDQQHYSVDGPDGRRLLTIADNRVVVLEEAASLGTFREVEVEVARADEDEAEAALARAVKRLRRAGAGAPDPTTTLTRVLGPVASRVCAPALDRRSTIEEVVRVALLEGLEELLAHEPGVRLDLGPDDVHDARVATRRLRSNLRTLRPVLDRSTSERLRDELSWAGALLGTVRDLDVMRSTFQTLLERQPAVTGRQLLAMIDGERAAAHRCLVASMHDPRWRSMMRGLEAAARLAPLRGTIGPMDRAEHTARALLRKAWRRCEQRAHAAEAGTTSWHEVRKAAKSVRYAAELFEPVLGRPTRSFARAIEAIQEQLGERQDLVVACEWLGHRVDDPQVGVVARQLCADFDGSSDDLPERWDQVWKHARQAASRVF